jgi:capsule polysaccharide export protein KpsE/RkpR
VLTSAFLMFAILVGLGSVRERTYTVSTSFIPQSRRVQSGVANLSAQFGITLGGAEPGQSPDFYVDLVRSPELMRLTALSAYRFPIGNGQFSGTLVDYFAPASERYALRLEIAVARLQSAVAAAASLKTGIVTLNVTTTSPVLSQQIANQVLAKIQDFNREVRRSQATEERKFTEGRLAEAADELRGAENRLQGFLQGNREYSGSPALGFERDRLTRDVSMRQQIYTSLAQAYEQAKIDEVRESSLITIISPPVVPALPNRRGLITRGLTGFLLGALIGIAIALIRAYWAGTRRTDPERFNELSHAGREILDGLKRPWRSASRPHGRQDA